MIHQRLASQELTRRLRLDAYAESIYQTLKDGGLDHRDAISVVTHVVGMIADELSQLNTKSHDK
jgi:hypothetical protein